jgi:DNA-3-methyladenine glycosylase II
LTVDALRRVPGNAVDVMTPDGRYMRALTADADAPAIVEVSQPLPDALAVRIKGPRAKGQLQTVATMLGAEVDLRDWYSRVERVPWLARLAQQLRGVKPPRYPELWEALCHGIIFQQLSIVAAAAIMQRFVMRFSTPVSNDSIQLFPFPRPEVIARARMSSLQSLGLSRMKASYLKGAAECVLTGSITADRIESLPSDRATAALKSLRGIGMWSAAVVLLRGFGRLDVFPPLDSGASRSMKLLSANPKIDARRLLLALDGSRGMLYFHLLLGTMHGLTTL